MIATAAVQQPVRYFASTMLTQRAEQTPSLLAVPSGTFRPIDFAVSCQSGVFVKHSLNEIFHGDAEFRNAIRSLLLSMVGDDGGADLPTTSYAAGLAMYMLPASRFALGTDWKAPIITSDSYGGLRLTWIDGKREIRAVIPQDGTSRKRYIYWQEDDRYGSIANFTPSTLTAWLGWVLNVEAGQVDLKLR